MDKECLRLTWQQPAGIRGCVDQFGAGEFDTECRNKRSEHRVICPGEAEVTAKYLLSVSASEATLDYTPFGEHNKGSGLLLGILTIVFEDPDRVDVQRVFWRATRASRPQTQVVQASRYLAAPLDKYQRPPVSAVAKRAPRKVKERPGQKQFRARLKRAYGGRCAISGCGVHSVLDAAHIDPFVDTRSDHPANGLLLRKDLHSLFDQDLIAIKPNTQEVYFHRSVSGETPYSDMHGRRLLRAPAVDFGAYAPDKDAIARRWRRFKRLK